MTARKERMDRGADLVLRATKGDGDAIAALFEQHWPRLQAFLRLRMGPALKAKESSSDLAQSVCREILEHLERYEYQGDEQFRRWLYTTALRKVSNRARHYRAQRRNPGPAAFEGGDAVLAELLHTSRTPSRHAAQQEQLERLEEAFAALPEHYREVITLSRIVGLSHKEIAAQMEKSEAATRQLLVRALSALTAELEKKGLPG